MPTSHETAVLSKLIYQAKPSSVTVDGKHWKWRPQYAQLPEVGVWSYSRDGDHFLSSPPVFIIAVKGTSNKKDLVSDLQVIRGREHKTTPYKKAKAVKKRLKQDYPTSPVTITGHSLGGTVARAIANKDKSLTAHAYNPGTSLAHVPGMLLKKAKCKLALTRKARKKCKREKNRVKQYTNKTLDPLSALAVLGGAKTRRNKRGVNTHTVDNFVDPRRYMVHS